MTFTQAVKTCFRKYVTFSGRASRPEYWWFFLFLLLGSFVMSLVDSALFGFEPSDAHPEAQGPLAGLFGLATFLPALAAGWRRMHDSGRSGLYLLYPLIAMVGLATFLAMFWFDPGGGAAPDSPVPLAIRAVIGVGILVIAISPLIVLWWLTRPSTPGPNPYGPNPHEVLT
ncbi:MAG: DUF805 domain-containing protein [Rhodobacteraceae bacterium]|nr:DUF805 domain-containing protein [Paracoccaceae bacterium]